MIHVGTSGYSYDDWVGPFYPKGTARNRMLDEYVRHFDVVEINSSYYRVPDAAMFERMAMRGPFSRLVTVNRWTFAGSPFAST